MRYRLLTPGSVAASCGSRGLDLGNGCDRERKSDSKQANDRLGCPTALMFHPLHDVRGHLIGAAGEPIRQKGPSDLKKSGALDETGQVFEAVFVPPGGAIPGRVVLAVAEVVGLPWVPVVKG